MIQMKLASLCLAALVASTFFASPSDAHGIFFANRADEKILVLGDGPGDNAYTPSMVTGITAYDTQLSPMGVEVVKHEKNIAIIPPAELGVTVTYFDYGYWYKGGNSTTKPSQNMLDSQKTTHAIKWNVNYWSKDVKPTLLSNIPIQIVPTVNPLTLRKGDTYQIQVFKDGKPYANAPLIADVINDLTNEITTDANGMATITVSANGLNVIGVEVAAPNSLGKMSQDKYFSSLSFIIDPE